MKSTRIIASAWLLALCLSATAMAATGAPAKSASASCVGCHQSEGLSDGGGRDLGPHQGLACARCHQGAEVVPHDDLKLASCRSCHQPHDEAKTGDLHAGVSCESCHFEGEAASGAPHRMARAGENASCRGCHFMGNKVGAAAMVLPPKSALCLACHTATLSLADWPSRIAIVVFLAGLMGSLGFWLSGTGQGPTPAHHGNGNSRASRFAAALVLDGLLQRRLFKLSPSRWLAHALIFFPFALRMLWALTALLLSLLEPGWAITQTMLNKNAPVTALFFDLTAIMVLAGAAAVIAQRMRRNKKAPTGLPRPDWLAMALVAGVVVSGLIVEAARIAMTGAPAGSSYAFVGYALSMFFTPGPGLQEAYGYLWYGHAVIYAVFVAYIPFSRMFHILLTPLSLAISAAKGPVDNGPGMSKGDPSNE